MLIVTTDEGNTTTGTLSVTDINGLTGVSSATNEVTTNIETVIYGAGIDPGVYSQPINSLGMCALIADLIGANAPAGNCVDNLASAQALEAAMFQNRARLVR